MSTNERREYIRIDTKCQVRIAKKISIDNFKELNIAIGKAINVSGSGMLISIQEQISLESVIRITFLKPNTFEFFETMGKVVRIDDNLDNTYLIGINFFYLTKSEKDRLNYYITL